MSTVSWKLVQLLKRNWLFLALLGALLIYLHAIEKKQAIQQELSFLHQQLEEKKRALKEEQEDLLLEITSQDDPAWIELTLMKEMGVVPETQVKVYFENQDRDR